MSSSLSVYDRKPDIIRVEQMENGDLIYIDTLAISKCIADISRSYVTPSYEKMLYDWIPNMKFRTDYDTLDEAKNARVKYAYPSDGVIAINIYNSQSYRIKDHLTIDVFHKDHKFYIARNGKKRNRHRGRKYYPIDVVAHGNYNNGVIYECIIYKSDDNQIHIKDPKERLDKSVPNNMSVFCDIKSILMSTIDNDQTIVRGVTDVSFKIRRIIYEKVRNNMGSKRTIIDVGSGRLQSYNLLNSIKGAIKILIDPKFQQPRNVREQITNISEYEEKSIIKLLESGGIGRQSRFYVYKGTMESFFTIGVVRTVSRYSIPICYAFSINHVYETYNNLCKLPIKQLGCCFVYDEVDDEGYLVNVGGIKMQLHKDGIHATVKFPVNDPYTERAIKRSDIDKNSIMFANLCQDMILEPKLLSVVEKICFFYTY
jgi:hypothetical protein